MLQHYKNRKKAADAVSSYIRNKSSFDLSKLNLVERDNLIDIVQESFHYARRSSAVLFCAAATKIHN